METAAQNEALALKYRPINFEELVGQESVSKTLSLALETKRLSHAYLFSGLRGSGKTSSARIFARALICDEGPKAKPCGVCPNCLAANPHKMRHIDIIELDGASNRKIDDIRDLIEQTKYHPNMARFKIFIIDEVHMLTKEAFNALLKTLEEPPPYVKFILATTDPLKVPATILSRTQHFRFKRISDKSILEHLKKILEIEKVSYQEEALGMLVRSGSGSLRDTLTLLDQAIIYTHYNITSEACAAMLGLINPQNLEALFEAIFKEDREILLEQIEDFSDYECEMLLDEMTIFLKEHLLSRDLRFNPLVVDRFFRIITQSKSLLALGANDSFVLTLALFKMLEALKVETLEQAIATLEKGVYEDLPHKIQNKTDLNINLSSNNTPKSLQQSTQEKKPLQENAPLESKSQSLADSSTIPNSSQVVSQTQELQAKELFGLLKNRIYERNYELGECFEKNIRFIAFADNILIWESSAKQEDKKRLGNAYSIIKNLVYEIFGMQTQIKNQEISQEKDKQDLPINGLEEKQSGSLSNQNDSQVPQEASQISNKSKTAEQEVQEALKTPLLEAMQKEFEITKINVRLQQ